MIDKSERQHWLTVARVLAFCYVQTLISLFCGRFPRKTVRGTGYLLRVKKINIPTLLHTWNVLFNIFHFTRSFNPGILIQFTFPSLLSYVWYISRLYNCKILGNFSHNHSLAVFSLVSVCLSKRRSDGSCFCPVFLVAPGMTSTRIYRLRLGLRLFEKIRIEIEKYFFFITPSITEYSYLCLQATRPGLPWEYFAPTFARGAICLSANLSFSGKGDIQNEFHLRCAFEAFRNTLY